MDWGADKVVDKGHALVTGTATSAAHSRPVEKRVNDLARQLKAISNVKTTESSRMSQLFAVLKPHIDRVVTELRSHTSKYDKDLQNVFIGLDEIGVAMLELKDIDYPDDGCAPQIESVLKAYVNVAVMAQYIIVEYNCRGKPSIWWTEKQLQSLRQAYRELLAAFTVLLQIDTQLYSQDQFQAIRRLGGQIKSDIQSVRLDVHKRSREVLQETGQIKTQADHKRHWICLPATRHCLPAAPPFTGASR